MEYSIFFSYFQSFVVLFVPSVPGKRVNKDGDDDGGEDGAHQVDGCHGVDLGHGRLGQVGDVGGGGSVSVRAEVDAARQQGLLVRVLVGNHTLRQDCRGKHVAEDTKQNKIL